MENYMESQSKLSLLYKHFKRELSFFRTLCKYDLRSLLTQSGSGTLPLDIETGRYYGRTRELKYANNIILV